MQKRVYERQHFGNILSFDAKTSQFNAPFAIIYFQTGSKKETDYRALLNR
jgi:hypothetical protein